MKSIRSLKFIDYVRHKKYCLLEKLQNKFKVSSATIHRDIALLASSGILLKMHGGVSFPENTAQYPQKNFSPFQERIEWNKIRKQSIARQEMQKIAFISAFGVTDENVTTNHERYAGLLMMLIQVAGQKILLADHRKFGREGLFKIATPRMFDQVILDENYVISH